MTDLTVAYLSSPLLGSSSLSPLPTLNHQLEIKPNTICLEVMFMNTSNICGSP